MKQYYLVLLTLLTLVACKKDAAHDEGGYVFIGGEIINPGNNYLVLSNFNCVLDTITLDENNRFLYKIEHLEPGLHSFAHGGEFQLVLLEPNDSIMFRLNTIDFDESLVFTGQGAKKNNYLMNVFLETEIEEKKVFKYSRLAPEKFETAIDSIRTAKTKKLKAFESEHTSSEMFNEIAQANIDYSYYLSKEVYPLIYFGYSKLRNLDSLPDDFYNYRETIDYNSHLLKDYFPYYTFLRYHFNNLATLKHFEHSDDTHFDRNSLCYNLDRISMIDSLTTNNDIKNMLLYQNVIRYVNASSNVESCDMLVKSFLSVSTDDKNKKRLAQLTNTLKTLKTGNNFPDINVVDHNDSELQIRSVFNKFTVIYFWTYARKGHYIESHNKISELRVKYPEFNFVGININTGEPKHWEKTLKEYNFSVTDEYQFVNIHDAKNVLALHAVNKVMVVDKNNKIAISNADIFNMKFEEQLLGLINR